MKIVQSTAQMKDMICDRCEVLMNFNKWHVCSEVYNTFTGNLSASFQKKKLQLVLKESVEFKFVVQKEKQKLYEEITYKIRALILRAHQDAILG